MQNMVFWDLNSFERGIPTQQFALGSHFFKKSLGELKMHSAA